MAWVGEIIDLSGEANQTPFKAFKGSLKLIHLVFCLFIKSSYNSICLRIHLSIKELLRCTKILRYALSINITLKIECGLFGRITAVIREIWRLGD